MSNSGMTSLHATSKWLNIFQYCRFLRLLGHIMVLLVLSLVGLTYTAVAVTYVPLLVSGRVLGVLGGALVMSAFTVVVALCVWSYLATVTVDPGRVPQGWHPFPDEQVRRGALGQWEGRDQEGPRGPGWVATGEVAGLGRVGARAVQRVGTRGRGPRGSTSGGLGRKLGRWGHG